MGYWLMYNLIDNQFLNFHGQPGARLNLHQSVYGENGKPRSRLMCLVSPLLFSAPDVYLQALDRIWVDYIAKFNLWVEFMRKLNTEWQEFIIIDTVLLNANVAFLAIQSVDNTTNNRSMAQIASYLSIVTSLGSIITALVLVRQHRTKNIRDAHQVVAHFNAGTERLAIVYSLPYVLLMWSVIAFLVAFLCMCFTFSDPITYGTVGSLVCVIGVLILYCIAISWETWDSKAGNKDISELTTDHDVPRNSGEAPSNTQPSSEAVHPDEQLDRDHGERTGWSRAFFRITALPTGRNSLEV